MPLNMMRYQRVSPDCLPPTNGRKLYMRTFKDEDDDDPQPSKSSRLPPFKPPLRPPSTTQDRIFPPPSASEPTSHLDSHPPNKSNRHQEAGGGGGLGDVLPQWGQNKRSRGLRAERSGSGDDSSNGGHGKAAKRKISSVGWKHATATMPPPGVGYIRGVNGRTSALTGVSHCRAVEERATTTSAAAPTRQEKRSPPSPPDRMRKAAQTTTTSAANGSSSAHVDSRNLPSTLSSEPDGAAPMAAEKLNLDLFEWPRIYISLSRKEKEDDFLAMKGTKLPQRPKKRAKNIDKNLQYCFPGMWLSDLTKGRYEVREKKCVKKKRRGLKGMENMDSDSD